ncbi:MAG: hypothetical protein ACI9W4_002781 [Rhodothermales bacterium]|jgi:hypothetical protein
MIVVKYFHEEPAALEVLAHEEAPDARGPATPKSLQSFLSAPKYYRGYLTATDLANDLTGATALHDASAWLDPICSVLGGGEVWVNDGSGSRAGALPEVLSGAVVVGTVVMLGSEAGADVPTLKGDIREHNRALRALLDAGMVVLRAEPAHDGADWALYSGAPLADRVRDAFRESPASESVARFVIPQRMARGEHKFYFERYELELFKAYRV